jgi:predicted transposase/invertase (TIGR01784 family)
MVNKIVDKALLKKIYEEVKHMLDILEIAMEDGVAKGRQEGRQEGEQNKAFQMARMLKHDGINISAISRASGLSAEELTRL